MTEEEWLKCEDPEKMLDQLGEKATPPKLRRLACECCRRLIPLLKSREARTALDVVERFIEGKAHSDSMSTAYGKLNRKRSKEHSLAIRSGDWSVHTAYQMLMGACEVQIANGVRTLIRMGKYHPIELLSIRIIGGYFRDIFSNPFRPVALNPKWLTPTVRGLALTFYNDRHFDRLPILADALEEAGCNQEDVLKHLRSGSEHVRGCWALDLVLGLS